ncbi:hypothetical protein AMECASPLE_014941 [Ameca splendens]|uniref:Secreted protein n=1 Tax=Ameca splendens TaxID=208324 RepID=A0ABV0XQL1_9TELE
MWFVCIGEWLCFVSCSLLFPSFAPDPLKGWDVPAVLLHHLQGITSSSHSMTGSAGLPTSFRLSVLTAKYLPGGCLVHLSECPLVVLGSIYYCKTHLGSLFTSAKAFFYMPPATKPHLEVCSVQQNIPQISGHTVDACVKSSFALLY